MIKSDKWIVRKSTLPTHRAFESGLAKGFGWAGVDFPIAGETVTVGSIVYHPVNMADLATFRVQNPCFPMIAPFDTEQVRSKSVKKYDMDDDERVDVKVISHGTSSYGYDVTLGHDFKIFTNLNSAIIDPKKFDDACLVEGKVLVDEDGCEYVILPPNSYLLGHTVEVFDIPRNVQVVCLGKSTYARAGAIVNVTPIEAEFKGQVVIEISNSTTLPLKIYANEGISQFLFFESDETCMVSYADRSGKYQNQKGVTLPRMK